MEVWLNEVDKLGDDQVTHSEEKSVGRTDLVYMWFKVKNLVCSK